MVKNKTFYPLTHPQKGIWYTEKFYPGTGISNIVGTLTITGEIDYLLLKKAINLFIKNNDGMRLRIYEDAFGAHQYVSKYEDKEFIFLDFSTKDGWDGVLEWINEDRKIPLNPINSDLYIFIIIKISDNEGGFYIKAHHTIVDAWTMILLGNQISDYYLKLKEGSKAELTQLPSYLDYIKSEAEYEQSPEFLQSKTFWLNKFETIPELTTLRPNKPKFASCEAKRKTFTLSRDLTDQLEQYSKESEVSIFILLISVLAVYLHKLLDRNDIVIGTPLLNRSTVKEKLTIGMFIETIPIRLHIDDNLDFLTFALQTAKEWKQMRQHRFPYNLLLEEIRERQKLTSNLYDIMLDYQNVKFELAQSFKPMAYFSGSEANSLCVHVSDRENIGQLNFDMDYQVDLFEESEIDSIYSHFITLLQDALESKSKKLYELEMANSQEKEFILYEINDTSVDFDREKTVHQLFEEQVERTPDNIAVIFENKKLTYRELNARANRLARVLRSKGVQSGSIAGLLVDRSVDMAVCILGILKAGAAYLPLDPKYPLKRINLILQDSKAELLLTQARLSNDPFCCQVLNIDELDNHLDGSNLINNNIPSDLAYIIYTSGSTGKPKGVMIEHKSVCSFFTAMTQKVDLTGKTMLSVTTISFDIFVFEMLLPLVNGSTVVIANEEQQLVPMALNSLIIEQGIDIIQTTPSRMNLILMDESSKKALKNVTDIILGGEAFPETLLNNLKSLTTARIFNGYGPTEATIYATFKELTNSDNVNIGRPVANTKAYILDKNLLPLPLNVPGELFIGGEGLARGYLYRDDLTKERFLACPFDSETLLYRTGDLAKWTSDGEIEFLGRIDFQVKLRGYRIELGEIENALCEHDQILDAVVIAQKTVNEEDFLCAFIVAKTNVPIPELRVFLSKTLPDYMIPASFVFLEEIPLNPNGKVCRATLKKLSYVPDVERCIPYVGARNEVDLTLIKSWTDTLNIEKIGIDDNFFDLGGDSLKIVKLLVSLLPFNWELTARDFYRYQTIRLLSDKIRGVIANDNWQPELENDIASIYSKHDENNLTICGKINKFSNILLTGATGYLGAHLLRELLVTTDAHIYCMVRGSSLTNAEEKLTKALDFYFPMEFESEIGRRIKIVYADLAFDRFGLSENQYNELGRKADTVIHAAAKVRHYGGYSEFEQINVIGTKRLIDFCLTFGQKLQYISTTSVSGRYLVRQNLGDAVFTENDFYIGQHYYENVYVRSKFEAENLIFHAMKNGLIATIYRVGMLSGRYSDGRFQPNIEDNGLYNRMKSVLHLGAIPEEFVIQELEYTPVDYCSRAIILLLKLVENKNKVFHVFNHKTILVSRFIMAAKLCGLDIEVKDKDSFSRHLKEFFSNPEQTEALTGIINDLNLAKTIGLQDSPFLASQITCEYLKQLGFEWPEIDLPYLNRLINYMKSISFLTKNINNNENDISIIS